MIAGICGGLAKYFEVDPAIVRIIFLLLFFYNGIGILAYLIMWIVIPTEPYGERVHYAPGSSATSAKSHAQSEEEVQEAEIIEETETGGTNANPETNARQHEAPKRDNRFIIGVILIAIGALFLLSEITPIISLKFFAPVIFIIIGAYILFTAQDKEAKK